MWIIVNDYLKIVIFNLASSGSHIFWAQYLELRYWHRQSVGRQPVGEVGPDLEGKEEDQEAGQLAKPDCGWKTTTHYPGQT